MTHEDRHNAIIRKALKALDGIEAEIRASGKEPSLYHKQMQDQLALRYDGATHE